MGILKRVKFTNVDASPRQMITDADYNIALKSFRCYNPNSSDVFIQFYDETSGTVTVGTTEPHYGAFLVPANAELIIGSDTESAPLMFFMDQLCVAVTTTDTGGTSPTSDCTVELTYWGMA